jgi:hypothetical protein
MNVFLVDSRTAGVLALVFTFRPASYYDPIALAGHLPRMLIFCRPPPHLLQTDAANCNGCAAKKKPGALKLYKKFRSTMPAAASKAMMMGWWIR